MKIAIVLYKHVIRVYLDGFLSCEGAPTVKTRLKTNGLTTKRCLLVVRRCLKPMLLHFVPYLPKNRSPYN